MLAPGPGAMRSPRNTNSPDSHEHPRISASIGPSQKAMQHARGTGVAISPSSVRVVRRSKLHSPRAPDSRPLVLFVSGVQHQLHSVEPEQRPIEVLTPRSGRGDNLEAQHIAVKLNGRGHVEDLQKRRHPLYANGHGILPLHAIALAVHGKASLDAGAKNCGARAAGGGLKKIEGGGTPPIAMKRARNELIAKGLVSGRCVGVSRKN